MCQNIHVLYAAGKEILRSIKNSEDPITKINRKDVKSLRIEITIPIHHEHFAKDLNVFF